MKLTSIKTLLKDELTIVSRKIEDLEATLAGLLATEKDLQETLAAITTLAPDAPIEPIEPVEPPIEPSEPE